uniref:Polymerase nucleotidyl transferase domain-containing protein n=1 Tax=Ditylenchus dipsaci TaxID=166011 RepID=A0A915CXD7_9BILA
MVSRKESTSSISNQMPVLQPALSDFSMPKRRFSHRQLQQPQSSHTLSTSFVDYKCWQNNKSPNKSNRRRRKVQPTKLTSFGSLASSCSLTSIASSTSSGIDSSSSSIPKVGERDDNSPPNSSTASSLGFEDDQELQSLNKEDLEDQEPNLPDLAALQLNSTKAGSPYPNTYFANNGYCQRNAAAAHQRTDLDFSNPTVQRYFEQQKQFYRQIYDQQFAACGAGQQPAFAPPNFVRPSPTNNNYKPGLEETQGMHHVQPPHQHLGLPPMPPPSPFIPSPANLMWNDGGEQYFDGRNYQESNAFCNGVEDKSDDCCATENQSLSSCSEGCSKESTPMGTTTAISTSEECNAQQKNEGSLQKSSCSTSEEMSTPFQVSRMDVLSEQILNSTKGDMLYYAISPMFPMCGLYVVGSSLNGFGNDKSDMDLCLMITNRDIDQRNDAVVVLSSIMRTLQNTRIVADQQLILAKVPILRIKFSGAFSDITVDLNAITQWPFEIPTCYATTLPLTGECASSLSGQGVGQKAGH